MIVNPTIHGNRRIVTKSDITTAYGDALLKIKSEDRLTWEDVGVIIGKCEDQAMKYASGEAEMGAFSIAFAAHAWGARFTAKAHALLPPHVDELEAHRAIREQLVGRPFAKKRAAALKAAAK